MLQYEESHLLFKHLEVKNMGRLHWSDNAGWKIAAALYECVLRATKECVFEAQFLSFTVDKVTTADNQNWLNVHAYFVKDWVRVPNLLSLTRLVEGVASKNLTQCCIDMLEEYGGVPPEKLISKLISVTFNLFIFAMPSVHCILIPQFPFQFANYELRRTLFVFSFLYDFHFSLLIVSSHELCLYFLYCMTVLSVC